MTDIVQLLMAEIDDLRGQFGPVHSEAVSDIILVQLQIRGVDVRVVIEPTTYPVRAPSIITAGGWRHPKVGENGRVEGLRCIESWNRTYGLGQVIRELNQAFIDDPPER